ncbi:MAG: sulfatase-like hydrolase/transferase, partial [Planctomycetota bacterium]
MRGSRTPRAGLLTGTCVVFLVALAPGGEAAERPNVLFIMSDDHAAQAISAYGGILAEAAPTPNIDRLAKGGMLFRNCFVTNSICTPSRAVIFTGKYSHRNGVYKFTALDQRQPTLPKMMRAAGYHTGFVGKYHLHSNPVGFDYWSVLPGQRRYHSPQFVEMGDEHPSGWVKRGKRTTYEGHSSDVIGDKAIAYLKGRAGAQRPFILFCHFKAPHDTWQYARRYERLFADVDIPEPGPLMLRVVGSLSLQLKSRGAAIGRGPRRSRLNMPDFDATR